MNGPGEALDVDEDFDTLENLDSFFYTPDESSRSAILSLVTTMYDRNKNPKSRQILNRDILCTHSPKKFGN